MIKQSAHLIIVFVDILCIILILQIDFGLIPKFNTSCDPTRADRINNVLSNLSTGIIVSSLFYLILVYIPKYYIRRSLNKIISNRLSTIIQELRLTTLYLQHTYSLSIDYKSLREDDFKNITQLTSRRMDFKYEIQNNPDGTYTKFNTGAHEELWYFDRSRKIVLEKIEEIFNQPTITYANDQLLELLCQLRDCWFYKGIESYLLPLPIQGNRVIINFNIGVYKYFLIYTKLTKHCSTDDMKISEEE